MPKIIHNDQWLWVSNVHKKYGVHHNSLFYIITGCFTHQTAIRYQTDLSHLSSVNVKLFLNSIYCIWHRLKLSWNIFGSLLQQYISSWADSAVWVVVPGPVNLISMIVFFCVCVCVCFCLKCCSHTKTTQIQDP